MTDTVDVVIEERGAMDRGLPGGLFLSLVGHTLVVLVALGLLHFGPKEPPIRVADGFAVQLPAGGRGTPNPEPPAPAASQPAPQPSAAPEPEAPPAPKLIKPMQEDEPKNALPALDAKKPKGKPTPTPPPKILGKPGTGTTKNASGPGGAGRNTQLPGMEFGVAGPGAPGGFGDTGDFYLASVQRKIWILWTQQIKAGMSQPAVLSFTIEADGTVSDVNVVNSSGVTMLDLAAKRAVFSAAPFGPLPRSYGTNRFTIQAVFKPTE